MSTLKLRLNSTHTSQEDQYYVFMMNKILHNTHTMLSTISPYTEILHLIGTFKKSQSHIFTLWLFCRETDNNFAMTHDLSVMKIYINSRQLYQLSAFFMEGGVSCNTDVICATHVCRT